jgi:hypothetical protein
MVAGDLLAEAGDDSALVQAERLRAVWPPVADGIAGRLHLRQGKTAEASRAFEASLFAYRSEPWPPPTFMLRTLGLAADAARKRPELARRLFALLAVPFAVHMMDEARAETRVALARLLPPGLECAEALDYFEPNVPWQADFLSFRAGCYQALGSPLAPAALRDLAEFRRHNLPPFPDALRAGGSSRRSR